jgi:hypothetical protein
MGSGSFVVREIKSESCGPPELSSFHYRQEEEETRDCHDGEDHQCKRQPVFLVLRPGEQILALLSCRPRALPRVIDSIGSSLPRAGHGYQPRNRRSCANVRKLNFGISTVRAFEGAPIVPHSVRSDAAEYHCAAAFWALRAYDRSGRCVGE